MMGKHNNRLKYKLFLLPLGLAVLLSGALLSGCAAKRVSRKRAAVPPIQTVAQMRKADIKAMQQAGVQVIEMGQTVTLVLQSDRLFMPNSANLKEGIDSRKLFRTMAEFIKSYQTVDIGITGYTDNRPLRHTPKNFQEALTARQAQEIADQLWTKNINTRLAVAYGEGKQNPVAWNGTPEGRKVNRRVEIQFRYYPVYNSWE